MEGEKFSFTTRPRLVQPSGRVSGDLRTENRRQQFQFCSSIFLSSIFLSVPRRTASSSIVANDIRFAESFCRNIILPSPSESARIRSIGVDPRSPAVVSFRPCSGLSLLHRPPVVGRLVGPQISVGDEPPFAMRSLRFGIQKRVRVGSTGPGFANPQRLTSFGPSRSGRAVRTCFPSRSHDKDLP